MALWMNNILAKLAFVMVLSSTLVGMNSEKTRNGSFQQWATAANMSSEEVENHLIFIDTNKRSWQMQKVSFKVRYNNLFIEYFSDSDTLVTYFDALKIGEGRKNSVTVGFIHWSDITSDTICAVKKLDNPDEFIVQSKFNHPNLVKSYGLGGNRQMILKYMGSDLVSFLTDYPLSYAQKLHIALQIACGVREMHRMGFAHQDLNPTNILLEQKEYAQVTIADFGNTRPIGAICAKMVLPKFSSAFQAKNYCEGVSWLVSASDDIWALGMLFYYLNFRELPIFSAIDLEVEDHGAYVDALTQFQHQFEATTGFEKIIKNLPNSHLYDRISLATVIDELQTELMSQSSVIETLQSPSHL